MYTKSYETYIDLQCKIKAQAKQLEAFMSGEKYVRMEEEHSKAVNGYRQKIAHLEKVIEKKDAETASVKKQWSKITDDLNEAFGKERKKLNKEIYDSRIMLGKAEEDIKELKARLSEETKQKEEALSRIEELNGQIQLLRAQMNHNYENSSLPSSMEIAHKKITNNREKSGKKPGAQLGHTAQPRERHIPAKTIIIPAPEEYLDTSKYIPAGEIAKQVVELKVSTETTEYRTPVFIERSTGHRVHAKFPEGVTDDINYDGSVKAIAFLLNTKCNVSIDNTRQFISDITMGELNLSKGLICSLNKQFSKKTEEERKEIFRQMLQSPVMHTDNTNARVNGENANVLICVTDKEILYIPTAHKGHEGIKGSPVETYQGILIHDHDRTFYSYGSAHQECLVHCMRYLKDSMENEKELTWNGRMRELLQEMIHYRNSHRNEKTEPEKIREFETRYNEILGTAKAEYGEKPPSKYYRDGYNLSKRMDEYMDSHLLFLTDERIEPDNNIAERMARKYKRKQKQVMTMRSFECFSFLCNALTIIETLRRDKENMFLSICRIFGHILPES